MKLAELAKPTPPSSNAQRCPWPSFFDWYLQRQLTSMLQEYFDEMTEDVIATEGVVDKSIGDASMVFCGAPIDQPDRADRSVKVANGMVKHLEKLNHKWASDGFPTIDIGIG